MALTTDQLVRRIPPETRAYLGPRELAARVNLASDILAEAEDMPDSRRKRAKDFVEAMLSASSFKAFLLLCDVLNGAIDKAESDHARGELTSRLQDLVSTQPLMLLAGMGEDITGILSEIAGEPMRRWWHRLMFWKSNRSMKVGSTDGERAS